LDVRPQEPLPAKRVPNTVLGLALGLLVLLMFSFAYANVPLFKLFCERFGIGGAGKAAVKGGTPPGISSTTGPIQSRDIRVTLMGITASGLPVSFKPSVPMVTTIPGQPVHLSYAFTNMSDDSVFFRAVHSIAPQKAAREFQLIQCFCFEDQSLGPREARNLPVYFALSPRLPAEIDELTLSYTLFPRDPKKAMPVPAKGVN
jgi:cytochrome c oxidase assembly protein subunit 11